MKSTLITYLLGLITIPILYTLILFISILSRGALTRVANNVPPKEVQRLGLSGRRVAWMPGRPAVLILFSKGQTKARLILLRPWRSRIAIEARYEGL